MGKCKVNNRNATGLYFLLAAGAFRLTAVATGIFKFIRFAEPDIILFPDALIRLKVVSLHSEKGAVLKSCSGIR